MYIELNGWKSKLDFAASHFIPGHPKCGRLHGHCYAVHLRIHGVRDEEGLIVDFSEIKHLIRSIIDGLDHHVMIPTKNPHLKLTNHDNEYEVRVGDRRYLFPADDVVAVPVTHTTVECLTHYLLQRVCDQLPNSSSIKKLELGLDEGPGQGAWVSRVFQ